MAASGASSSSKPTATAPKQKKGPPPQLIPDPTVPLEILYSQQGVPMVSKNNYMYNFSKEGLNKKIWECTKRRRFKCRAILYSTPNLETLQFLAESEKSHNHAPDPIGVELKRVISTIRKEAEGTEDDEDEIIDRNFAVLSTAAQSVVPARKAVKRMIKSLRSLDAIDPADLFNPAIHKDDDKDNDNDEDNW